MALKGKNACVFVGFYLENLKKSFEDIEVDERELLR